MIGNHRYYTLLRMPAEGEVIENQKVEIEENEFEKNKDFTSRRRALFLHYLDKHFHICADRRPLAEIAHFLTGNSEDNLYKRLLNPLKTRGDDSAVSEKVLKGDLIYIKCHFERLGLKEIVKSIEKDVNSF